MENEWKSCQVLPSAIWEIGITFKFNAMGNFQLAGDRESRGKKKLPRVHLKVNRRQSKESNWGRVELRYNGRGGGRVYMKLKLEIQMQIETDKRLVNPKQPTRWPLMAFLRFIEEISSRRTDILDNLAACWKWNVWKWLIKCGYNFSNSSPASSTSITLLAFTCAVAKSIFLYLFI